MIRQTAAVVAFTHADAAWLCSISVRGLMTTERNKNQWHEVSKGGEVILIASLIDFESRAHLVRHLLYNIQGT